MSIFIFLVYIKGLWSLDDGLVMMLKYQIVFEYRIEEKTLMTKRPVYIKTILFFIIGILLMGNTPLTYAASENLNINVLMTLDSEWAMINSEPFKLEQAPVIIGGRTMVPLRFITEALGLEITWEAETRSVLVEKDGNLIRLFIDSHTAELNGKSIMVDVPPTILNGRTLVPVRFVSEVLGYSVGWEGRTSEVTITGSIPPVLDETKPEPSIENEFAYEVLRLVNIEREKIGISHLNIKMLGISIKENLI